MKVANVDRLRPFEVAHLARRYDALAVETHHGFTPESQAQFAEIADALRAHPNHPRST